jgi:diguanylate cyclase (GGDEF)-like protein
MAQNSSVEGSPNGLAASTVALRGLERRLGLSFVLIVSAIIATLFASIAFVALRAQTQTIVGIRTAMIAGIDHARSNLLGEINDFAVSDAAVERVHARFDEDWAIEAVAMTMARVDRHRMTVIVGPDDQARLVWVDGQPAAESQKTALMAALAPAIASFRSRGVAQASTSTLITLGESACLVAGRAVQPASGAAIAANKATLLFACHDLDRVIVPTLKRLYGLSDLSIEPSSRIAPAARESRVILSDIAGRPAYDLRWTNPEPWYQAVSDVAPVIIVAFLGLAALVGFALSRAKVLMTSVINARLDAERQARFDGLTGLANRMTFFTRLKSELAEWRRDQSGVAVLYIDLDGFKGLNDSQGHGAGDRVLQEVARRLEVIAPRHGLVGRLGGDEFVMLVTQLTPGLDVREAERITKAIQRPIKVGAQDIQLNASIGIARCPDHGDNAEELLRRADIAMYDAKRRAAGSISVFDSGMERDIRERKAIERELREALLTRQFDIWFQPIVDASRREIVGAEALLRWTRRIGGPISPATFIPMAEKTGLILELGLWVLRTACMRAARWTDLRITVNVSPLQLKDPGFVEQVRTVLAETGLAPDRLVLEVTEGVMLEAETGTIQVIEAIRALGVRIALDDFGSGYSSLSYLRQLPCDIIKIDKAFVRDATESSRMAALVAAIVGVGHALGLRVVAEGVETEADYTLLAAAGCDYIQGYLTGRPESIAAFEDRFAEKLRVPVHTRLLALAS